MAPRPLVALAGTEVTAMLPAQVAGIGATGRLSAVFMSSILIIEDDRDLAELMAITLRTAGYETRLAPDGRTALEALQEAQPDLVLLDVMLPDVIGFSLCETLRRFSATLHLPILMVSACDEFEARPLARAAGANGYLPKPFSPRELLSRTRALLKRSQQRAA